MESIVTAVVTGVMTLLGVLFSNSRSQAVIEVKLDELSRRVEKHNQVIERQHATASVPVAGPHANYPVPVASVHVA